MPDWLHNCNGGVWLFLLVQKWIIINDMAVDVDLRVTIIYPGQDNLIIDVKMIYK